MRSCTAVGHALGLYLGSLDRAVECALAPSLILPVILVIVFACRSRQSVHTLVGVAASLSLVWEQGQCGTG